MPLSLAGTCNQPCEIVLQSEQKYADPFTNLELDLVFTHENGEAWRVPAFWSGGRQWRVRFAPPRTGQYRISSICTDVSNASLHGVEATLEAAPYTGENRLLKHGPLKVSANRRFLEHADSTPFFWLADTWWMGLCSRVRWPEFPEITEDRVQKGFTAIQIVAGLYPDMPPLDTRCSNESGTPWEPEFSRIRPAYFDNADQRIKWLVEQGLVPCIVGCWGYYLKTMGPEKMKQHWRYLIARWGAWPVVWCLAGEATMPYYLSKDKKADADEQKRGWTEMARYVRETDPYGRIVTIHPTTIGRDQVEDDSLIDFDMLQTGHTGSSGITKLLQTVTDEIRREPVMPVINGESNYEGILHGTGAETQRLGFWACMLSGAAGHTYGANGLWQANRPEQLFGLSPHGANWGRMAWKEAMRLPGAEQMGLGKRLLERFEWWRFESRPDWTSHPADPDNAFLAYAAGIPGEVRVLYRYTPEGRWRVLEIEPDLTYRAFFFDPRNGEETDLGTVSPDEKNQWVVPLEPEMSDWVLVLIRE